MLVVTWNADFALRRNKKFAGEFAVDVGRFARAVNGTLRPGPKSILTRPNVADIERLHRLGLSGLPIAVDIETGAAEGQGSWTGKDPTQARLKTIGLGTEEEALSYEFTAEHELNSPLSSLFGDKCVVKLFHNGAWFDLRVLSRYRFDVRNWVDTRDARRALSSTSRLGLGYLASLYDDAPPWKEHESDEDEEDQFK